MSTIKLKTAKRKTTVNRATVRKVVSGVFVNLSAATTPKKAETATKVAVVAAKTL